MREVRHPGSQTPTGKSDTGKSDTHRFVVGWMPSAAICGSEQCAETVFVDTPDGGRKGLRGAKVERGVLSSRRRQGAGAHAITTFSERERDGDVR
jgi:hypothetical protein